jgi:hypothetical protein
MSAIAELWQCKNEEIWRFALKTYWLFVKPKNRQLEEKLGVGGLAYVKGLNDQGWYDFLHNEYFRWKFTAANRYQANAKHLETYQNGTGLAELSGIRQRLLSLDPDNIEQGLRTASEIKGLATAGASGLLALLYPRHFGTVDQFVVSALAQIKELGPILSSAALHREALRIEDGVCLIKVMREKAAENNRVFGCTFWTPRVIDMILWAYGHES